MIDGAHTFINDSDYIIISSLVMHNNCQVAATSKASDDVGDDDGILQHQNNQSTVLTLSTTSITAQPTAEVDDQLSV